MNGKVVYSCPFVPAEWITAHGFTPSRIMPRAVGTGVHVGIRAGVCPYAHAFMNSVMSESDASAIIVTTLCDQMRRISECISENTQVPIFLMNVPHTWESINAQKLYASELKRLGRFLVRLGGSTPSNDALVSTMLEYDAARTSLRDARGRKSARTFSESLAAFHESCTSISPLVFRETCSRGEHLQFREQVSRNTETLVTVSWVRIGLVGGPLLGDHFDIFDFIENAGGRVVLDGTETGERTMPARFDRRELRVDPFTVLVQAYFGSIPDAARRPNSALYQWLRHDILNRDIQGMIMIRHIWCDTWHAEAQRMREWLDIPFFDLDITEDATDMSRKLTRLQAFMEMLT